MKNDIRPADIIEKIFKANPGKEFARKDFFYLGLSEGNINTAIRTLRNHKIIKSLYHHRSTKYVYDSEAN